MIRELVIVVPAADEHERIGACLDALHEATARALPAGVGARIVVVLDGCRDGTAEIVAGYPLVQAVESRARCVGAARAAGTAAALAAISTPRHAVWTAHTDADSQVPAHWLTHMLAAAQDGAHLVLGTVVPSSELPRPSRRAWRALHQRTDGHPHIHGANLGIRADVLDVLGGWPALRTGEDVDLVTRAQAGGARISRTGAIPVRTSARADGRAPEGFSSYLRALAARPDQLPA